MALAYELIKVLPYGTFLTQRQKTMTRSDTAGAKGHFLFNNTATWDDKWQNWASRMSSVNSHNAGGRICLQTEYLCCSRSWALLMLQVMWKRSRTVTEEAFRSRSHTLLVSPEVILLHCMITLLYGFIALLGIQANYVQLKWSMLQ